MKARRKNKKCTEKLREMFIPLLFFLCCCFSRHTGKKRNSNHFSFISDVRYMCGSSGWSRRGCENGIESLNCVKKKRRVGDGCKKMVDEKYNSREKGWWKNVMLLAF